jgi:dTDP-4-dehydrorhamnose reductase
MRVLVTGVTGQVGGALVRVLGQRDSITAPRRDELDLAQPARIAEVLDRLAPDLIINPAAYTAVDRAEDERETAFRINAEAPAAIARWAVARDVPLIHFSTDYVFNGEGNRPWREEDPTSPLSVYGASKLAGEEAIRSARGPHLIIRTSWVYAAQGTNFLRTIVRLARERKELRVVADQFGAPTSAQVLAEAVASLVEPGNKSLADRFAASHGLVNVAAAGETSWHGFATAIVRGLQTRGVGLTVEKIAPIATASYPVRARRPANSRLDLTQLQDLFAITTPQWHTALDVELDQLALELARVS